MGARGGDARGQDGMCCVVLRWGRVGVVLGWAYVGLEGEVI